MAGPNERSSGDPIDDAAIVEHVIGLMGALDIDAVLGWVTEDVVLEFPFRADGGPRRLQGPEAVAFFRGMPRLFSALPFHDVVVHGRLPSGMVVAEYKSTGTTRREGRPYPNAYVALFGLRDGRIATWPEYFDPNVVAAAFPGP